MGLWRIQWLESRDDEERLPGQEEPNQELQKKIIDVRMMQCRRRCTKKNTVQKSIGGRRKERGKDTEGEM